MKKSGFTLIELSVVLVIVGLLVGGVLVGRDLIRAAEFRSVIADIDRYKAAYNTFKSKYNCIPGDCANATNFFGAQDPTPATCEVTSSPGTLTCNGNGNELIDDPTYEMFRFWQQLAIASMIKGKFTGTVGPAGVYSHVIGVNAPATAIAGTGFSFSSMNLTGVVVPATYSIDYGKVLWWGAVTSGANYRTQFGFLTTAEAKNLDTKIDDGKPASGIVIGRSGNFSGIIPWGDPAACTTSVDSFDLTGIYNAAITTIACSFMIKTGL